MHIYIYPYTCTYLYTYISLFPFTGASDQSLCADHFFLVLVLVMLCYVGFGGAPNLPYRHAAFFPTVGGCHPNSWNGIHGIGTLINVIYTYIYIYINKD